MKLVTFQSMEALRTLIEKGYLRRSNNSNHQLQLFVNNETIETRYSYY